MEQRGESPTEALLTLAHSPAYPFFILKLKKIGKDTPDATLNVRSDIYDFLTKHHGTDEILVYCGLSDGRIEAWSPDMQFTVRLLAHLTIMDPASSWIPIAREYSSNFLTHTKGTKRVVFSQSSAEKMEDILRASAVLEEVQAAASLVSIARDLILSGVKDRDTITYRMAMTLYHSHSATGIAALPSLEDPAALYLRIVENPIMLKKYRLLLDEFEKLAPNARAPVMKTFIAFVAGAYLCYRASQGLQSS